MAFPPEGSRRRPFQQLLMPASTLLDRFGTMTFTQVIAPTQTLLRQLANPVAWHADFARTLETLVDAEAQANLSGSAIPAGDRLRPWAATW